MDHWVDEDGSIDGSEGIGRESGKTRLDGLKEAQSNSSHHITRARSRFSFHSILAHLDLVFFRDRLFSLILLP